MPFGVVGSVLGTRIAEVLYVTRTFATTLLLTAIGTFGCAGPATIRFIEVGAQECADNALQRNPDRTILNDAVQRFDSGCSIGDPAACSLLGVMFERGLAVRMDLQEARKLYDRACKRGNRLGCYHLRRTDAAALFLMPNAADIAAKN